MEKQEAIDFILQEHARKRSDKEIALALSQELRAPVELVEKFVLKVIAENKTPIAPSQSAPLDTSDKPSSEKEHAEIEEAIVKALIYNRQHSDIVLEVCDRTGLSWDDAETLIEQVAVKRNKYITSRRNVFLIPFSMSVLLAGIALVYAGGSEVSSVVKAFQNGQYHTLQEVFPFEHTVYLFLMGLGMIGGGTIGLFKAFKSQFET